MRNTLFRLALVIVILWPTPLHESNDLHKASGGGPKNQPAHFFALDSTKSLVSEIQSTDVQIDPVQSIRGGSAPGTFVVKELVYAYELFLGKSLEASEDFISLFTDW